jgi:dTDP-4-dehydrorhamnose reductase
MRIVLFGKHGQIGWELRKTLVRLGQVHAFGSDDLDLSDIDKLVKTLKDIQPQIIVNAAAYTAVDKAETEPDRAMQINSLAPGTMAETARLIQAVLIHYSTDYVFDGAKGVPYTEEDVPSPINVYGKSKLAGERAIQQAGCAYLILRTSWVYSLRGENFLTKLLSRSRQRETLCVVSDQIGSPTWARMLADVTTDIVAGCGPSPLGYFQQYQGLYHLAGTGSVSRLRWAQEILDLERGKDNQETRALIPVSSVEFPDSARRPPFSALDCERIQAVFDFHLHHWEYYLSLALRPAV